VLTAVSSGITSIAPVDVEPRVATVEETGQSKYRSRQELNETRHTEHERLLPLLLKLLQLLPQRLPSQRPIILLLRLDSMEPKSEDQRRFRTKRMRLRRSEDDEVRRGSTGVEAEEAFASGDAGDEGGFGGGSLFRRGMVSTREVVKRTWDEPG
jgi:hypothetical protein